MLPGAAPSRRRRSRWPVQGCLRSGSSPSSGRSWAVASDHDRRWCRPHGPAGSVARSPPGPHAAQPGPRSRPGGACPWERPVVIGRPVDQDDLDPAALATAPDDPAAGPDDRLGHDQPPRRVERASQALGHRPRVSAAATRSIPVNSSSVKASGPDRLRCRLRSRRHHLLFLGPHRLVHRFSLSQVRRARQPCVPTVSAGAGAA
jgi:hypothetical protein